MKKILFNLYIKYKIKFNRPLYRVDILRYVKYIERRWGLCYSIYSALFGRYTHTSVAIGFTVSRLFPLMDRKNAMPFNAHPLNAHWWPVGDWTGGRMDFLNWLIDQYKDDKTDLRKLSDYENVDSKNR